MICLRHKIAEIPLFTPHDLRHRYISLLVMAGVPLPVVREVVGHSRASVTRDVYSHVLLDEPPGGPPGPSRTRGAPTR